MRYFVTLPGQGEIPVDVDILPTGSIEVSVRVTASLISMAVAAGNSDHKSAIVPVTKGTATLVPLSVTRWPSAARLVMLSPGALKPRLPIELPRFDSFIGRPRRSQATTGMTHG